jgi:hypothetical protein
MQSPNFERDNYKLETSLDIPEYKIVQSNSGGYYLDVLVATQNTDTYQNIFTTTLKSDKNPKIHEALYNLYTAIHGTDPNDTMEAGDRRNFAESIFDEQYIEDSLRDGNTKSITEIVENKVGELNSEAKKALNALESAVKSELQNNVLDYREKRK